MKRILAFVVWGILLAAPLAGDEPALPVSPVTPQQALELFQLHPDCRISLVAAEPDVIDPVHIAFDDIGRMWVVECSDYPNGPAEGEPGGSRIRVLTDEDGDGRYENAVVFVDQLLFATGLLVWKDGVIVTTSGSVLYFRDTDGDGKADEREEWFVGFKEDNPQLRANHPTLGPDGWIYIASGLRGGDVRPGSDWAGAFGVGRDENGKALIPEEPVSLSGRDFRFDPDTGAFEAVTGVGQFGLSFDDWGNRFVCDNRHPCKHIIMEERALKRNPQAAIAKVFHDVLPAGDDSRLYPISRAWTTSNLHANQFTAACGLCIYRGDCLPGKFYGNAFVCDPTGNLVHRAVLTERGATFDSYIDRPGIEFLASPDEWFRPVNLTYGPDGALYIVDMYRAVIEHPQFMPEELKTRPDLVLGNDRGRIWKVTSLWDSPAVASVLPSEGTRADAAVVIETPADWCALLEHSNGWHRHWAFRKLLEGGKDGVTERLSQVLGESPMPQARTLALRLLDRFGVLSTDDLLVALRDADCHVQQQAILVAGNREVQEPEVASEVSRLARQSASGAVLFQAALELPSIAKEPAGDLSVVLSHREADEWIAQAVATAPPEIVFETLRARPASTAHINRSQSVAQSAFEKLYEVAGATASPEQLSQLLAVPATQKEMASLAAGLRRRGLRVETLIPQVSETAQQKLTDWLQQMHTIATTSGADSGTRLLAIATLAHDSWENAGPTLHRIIEEDPDSEARAAAIDVLAQFRTADIGTLLLGTLTMQPANVRAASIRTMLSSPARVTALLDAVESGLVPPQMIDAASIRRLTGSGSAENRKRATRVFAALTPAARQEVLAKYQPSLSLPSDPLRGQEVFKQHCSTCHRIGEIGVQVAPDISDSRTKTPEYLLTAILDPNRAIDNNYFAYTIVDVDGITYTGVIAGETATSVTLMQPEGKTVTLLRDNIDTMVSSGVSLMPEGLERNISLEQMADLISFIKNWRYLDGSVPPDVIR